MKFNPCILAKYQHLCHRTYMKLGYYSLAIYIYTYTHTQTYSFIHLRIHILLSPLILWMLRYFWKWFYYANFLYLWKTKLIQHFKQLRNFYLIQVQKSTCIYFVICRFNLKKKINTTKEWMKLVLKQKRGTQRVNTLSFTRMLFVACFSSWWNLHAIFCCRSTIQLVHHSFVKFNHRQQSKITHKHTHTHQQHHLTPFHILIQQFVECKWEVATQTQQCWKTIPA